MSKSVLHQWLSVSSLILGLQLALSLKKVPTTAGFEVTSALTHFLPKLARLALVLSLEPEYLLLVGSKPFLLLLNFSLLASHQPTQLFCTESEPAQGLFLVEFFLAQLFDFSLESLIESENIIIGVYGLIEFPLKDFKLALALHGFSFKGTTLEGF